jgi:hypothetical protein
MRHLAQGKGKKRDLVEIYARKEGFSFMDPTRLQIQSMDDLVRVSRAFPQ